MIDARAVFFGSSLGCLRRESVALNVNFLRLFVMHPRALKIIGSAVIMRVAVILAPASARIFLRGLTLRLNRMSEAPFAQRGCVA